jgi:hypothetical protein
MRIMSPTFSGVRQVVEPPLSTEPITFTYNGNKYEAKGRQAQNIRALQKDVNNAPTSMRQIHASNVLDHYQEQLAGEAK